jgi:hypothetical protein
VKQILTIISYNPFPNEHPAVTDDRKLIIDATERSNIWISGAI